MAKLTVDHILGYLDERLAQVNREFPFDGAAEYIRRGRLAAFEEMLDYITTGGGGDGS